MALYEFEGKRPVVGEETYVCETADIIGDVIVGARCYIGPGARIKGDYGSIRIGDETNVQENCILHARPNETCKVGNRVNVGHGAILHTCTIEDQVLIGMGSIVSDYAIVGTQSVLGEGCVVTQNQNIPAGSVAVGVPARVKGKSDPANQPEWSKYKGVYVELARRYRRGLKRIE
ncbi:MAG: gamma carbonic anhydrase family protein [Planctomycetota bacterium]|nr:gamma carbonic anhydrase family protein [Planctomycetota bacterium]